MTIRHRDDCTGAEVVRTRGRLGDAMDRCRGCGRFVLVAELIAADPVNPDPAPVEEADPPPPVRRDDVSRALKDMTGNGRRHVDGWPTHRHRARLRRRRNAYARRHARRLARLGREDTTR